MCLFCHYLYIYMFVYEVRKIKTVNAFSFEWNKHFNIAGFSHLKIVYTYRIHWISFNGSSDCNAGRWVYVYGADYYTIKLYSNSLHSNNAHTWNWKHNMYAYMKATNNLCASYIIVKMNPYMMRVTILPLFVWP